MGYVSLFELYGFLADKKLLREIPFVVDGSNLGSEDLAQFRKYEFIDEIVFLQHYNKNSLSSKVNFLKKIKKQAENQHVEGVRKVETSISQNYSGGEISKRIFDIVLSIIMIILLSPAFLLIMIALKIESKGPVFYIAKRAGRGYRIFNFYKFRTMFVGADEKISEFSHLNQYAQESERPVFIKINNDPRITKIGAFLRHISLDELPQLFNVLKGDMSLVGNRPLPLYEAASLTTDEWAKRFMAPAGITGLWQIKKRGREEMSVEERISLDINYADKYSFFYDLWIMANTPSALIQKANA
jgi:lipopolysaccharide/colanic/teichoic acid biosynthesis glycosyltransferase